MEDISKLSQTEKKELALKLAKELKPDVEARQSLIDELQSIDNSSVNADIQAWANPTKK